jgi:uncharacterized protein UPF0158
MFAPPVSTASVELQVMARVVNLQDIVDELSIMSDVMKSFVDRETGEAITVEIEDLHDAEVVDDEDADETALAIVKDPGRYAWLPRKYEVNDWEIMREFCETVEPPKRRQELLGAIRGRGAFGHFNDLATDFGILKDWYAFREDALREIAREWCEENEIEYKDIRRPGPE